MLVRQQWVLVADKSFICKLQQKQIDSGHCFVCCFTSYPSYPDGWISQRGRGGKRKRREEKEEGREGESKSETVRGPHPKHSLWIKVRFLFSLLLFYVIATVFQLYLGGDMM